MPISYGASLGLIFGSCALGFIWAVINWLQVKKVNLNQTSGGEEDALNTRMKDEESRDKVATIQDIGNKIHAGAQAFLKEEYKFCVIVLGVFALILFFAVDAIRASDSYAWRPFVAFSFLVGGSTSILCGYLSMMIATSSNFRTSYSAQKGLAEAFKVALGAGVSMGFILVSIALFMITLLIVIYKAIVVEEPNQSSGNDVTNLFEFITGFGLGGSTVGLFGRVGGGIYTKAADVGADLVGKVEQDLPEDSPRNPATIADNVGDNVGDVAGMGADLFGSFAESTCAALVVSGSSLVVIEDGTGYIKLENLFFPLMISAAGIICCIFISAYGVFFKRVEQEAEIESSLKQQLLFSSIILTPAIIGVAYLNLPTDFYIPAVTNKNGEIVELHPWRGFVCTLIGLWAGLAIGYFTEYMTSHSYSPVREVAQSCRTGAATNIIYGLALGYLSTIVPIFCIGIAAYVSLKLLSYYGVALAALGMLSNLPIGLAIDGYGPISDNAGGIAEMAEMGEHIRQRTDALDAAGNTTAAIGKGFAIGSAALVSLSLYGGFLTNASSGSIDPDQRLNEAKSVVINPLVFTFLLIGSMLPYAFSAFTMKSVGKAALEMVNEIREQIKADPGIINGTSEPDYQSCIAISTKSSLKEMIAPGLLVILSPLLTGFFFGPLAVSGLLPGALISGVQMAISASNTGGAWDNAKKYIEAGQLIETDGTVKKKGSDEHKAAVIGDTVGDPLKDTSGPSLNILIKLMAITSLVFAKFFGKTAYLAKAFDDQWNSESSTPAL